MDLYVYLFPVVLTDGLNCIINSGSCQCRKFYKPPLVMRVMVFLSRMRQLTTGHHFKPSCSNILTQQQYICLEVDHRYVERYSKMQRLQIHWKQYRQKAEMLFIKVISPRRLTPI